MRIVLKLSIVTVALVGLTGCESLDRFEAWKMEALFGVPNPYNAEPVYGQPVYVQPVYAQPVYGQPTMYYSQPTQVMQTVPAVSGQTVPAGYMQVVPQPVVQPATQPQALLPPAAN